MRKLSGWVVSGVVECSVTEGSDRLLSAPFSRKGFFLCTRRGGISGAAPASSPLWPRCAAIQPGNLRFAVGEALSHDARSDALRLSEKVRSRAAITHRLRLSLACIQGAAHGARSLRKSSGICLPSFEFRSVSRFVPALPRQSIQGSCPSRGQGECGFLRPTIELRTLFS